MARFLIEVPHEPETIACARAVQVLMTTGSHFLTHADWGCHDGEHKGWLLFEGESAREARACVPSAFRARAKVVRLNRFTLEGIDELLLLHQA